MNTALTHHLHLDDQIIAYDEARPSVPPSGSEAAATVPLVLLHGGVVDRRLWGPQLGAFPDRHVIAPDARGHGGSSDATSPHRLTDDVIALLDGLGIDRAVLAGVSMGGGTAVDTALEHPDRVAGLVVIGTGTSEVQFSDPWTLDVLESWQAAQEQGDLEAWFAAFMRFTTGPHRERSEIDPLQWELVETMARETIADHLAVGPDGQPIPPVPATPVTSTWERLPSIEVPVLAVSGALDGQDHRDLGRRLVSSVPKGEHVEIPGAAHYPNLDDTAVFDEAVGQFLERHGL